MNARKVARLPDPDPSSTPAEAAAFLATLPPDTMVRMLAHSPSTVESFVEFARILFTGLELPDRDRELAVLTTAVAAECDFVFAQHLPISAAAGVSEAIRQQIAERRFASPVLAARDGAVIGFAAHVALHAEMPDAVFQSARAFLSAREIVELLHVCGYYLAFCRINTVLRVPLTRVYGAASG